MLIALLFCFLTIGGPTVPIKPRFPTSGSRTPPRVTKTENKNDDKLFEFLNSNLPASKEKKPAKPKMLTDNSSETTIKTSDSVEKLQGDVADGRISEGKVSADPWSSKFKYCLYQLWCIFVCVSFESLKVHARLRTSAK